MEESVNDLENLIKVNNVETDPFVIFCDPFRCRTFITKFLIPLDCFLLPALVTFLSIKSFKEIRNE